MNGPERRTAPAIRAAKGRERLAVLTAYDFPTARLADGAGADIVLIGDSLGMVVLGYPTTLPVTVDEMIHHSKAVMRAAPRGLVVTDMPFMSFQTGPAEALANAGRIVKETGVDAVKLEGGERVAAAVHAIVEAGIPVMGHLGLTPQSVLQMGGYKVQGRGAEEARVLLADARRLAEAGVFAIVLEGLPTPLAGEITAAVPVPTIGIGAGPSCDGQVLVWHDVLGLYHGRQPRFVRRYAELWQAAEEGLGRFVADVKAGRFPGPAESYE